MFLANAVNEILDNINYLIRVIHKYNIVIKLLKDVQHCLQ